MLNSNIAKIILLLLVGAIFGVFFSQYSYFTLEKSISLSDLLLFALTSLVAIYIADNIARSLSKVQTIKNLYQEDVKQTITYLQKIEDWIDSGIIPAAELRSYLRSGTLMINSLIKIYDSIDQLETGKLNQILNKFNDFKNSITLLNTSNQGKIIQLNIQDQNRFREEIEEIKSCLVKGIIDC
jgi:hypothetical protein